MLSADSSQPSADVRHRNINIFLRFYALPAKRLNTQNHHLIFSRAQEAENGNKRRALGSGLPKITENDKLIHLKNKMGYRLRQKVPRERDLTLQPAARNPQPV